MQRFPHLDLEAAMAAHDMPMYLLERSGVGAAVEYRICPLNQAAATIQDGLNIAFQALGYRVVASSQ